MVKWIRWPGLIAFFVISGLIALITIVFLDSWIKLAAEKGLEEVTGAEVNIAEVSHQFSPFGVTLSGIQLTDAANPQNNQLQASQISALVDLPPLLMRKVIIDELTVSGVQFNQPRASKGAVYRQPEASEQSQQADLFAETQQELPSVDDVLANSPLKTTAAIDATEQAYAKHKASLEAQYAELPSKEKLQSYQERVKALTETDYKNPAELAKAKKAFDQLRAELKADKQKLNEFKQAVNAAQQDLTPKLAELKAAPGQDYDQLKAVVAGDSAAIGELTQAIFGEQAAQWSDYLLTAYQMLEPMLGGGNTEEKQQHLQGDWYDFSDTSHLPQFLVRKARISLQWQNEQIDSHWQDITHQHDKLGRATVFEVDSAASSLWQSLKLNGDFWLKAQGVDAKQNWQLVGLSLRDMPLLQQKKLQSELQKGLLSSSGKLAVAGSQLDGAGNIDLSQLSIEAKGENRMTNVIASTLSGLQNLTLDTQIGGSVQQPDLSVSSNLDSQLGNALLSNLGGDEKARLDELKQKLNDKIAGPLGQSGEQMNQLLDWQQLADGNLNSIEEMLNAKFKGALDKKKDELADKLKGKLFGD